MLPVRRRGCGPDLVPLAEWVREAQLYRQLRALPFFNQNRLRTVGDGGHSRMRSSEIPDVRSRRTATHVQLPCLPLGFITVR
jgi:hypothetical protein